MENMCNKSVLQSFLISDFGLDDGMMGGNNNMMSGMGFAPMMGSGMGEPGMMGNMMMGPMSFNQVSKELTNL